MTVGSFQIDATEVTVEQFREFVDETGSQTVAERTGGGYEWDAGWQQRPGWNVFRPFGEEPVSQREPAVHVSWHEALAYCRWRGGRLPTAAEWRHAAYTETRPRPTDGFESGERYRYPVGNKPEGMNLADGDPWPVHAPAGSSRRGINGLYEMGGNVWEWLADRRGDDALTAGGSWWYGSHQTTAEGMQWKPADFFAVYVGFRCLYENR